MFFKQKTAYEMRISDWSSDVCSSDLPGDPLPGLLHDSIGLAVGAEVADALEGRAELGWLDPHGLDPHPYADVVDRALLDEVHDRQVGAVEQDEPGRVRDLHALAVEGHVHYAEAGERARVGQLDLLGGGHAELGVGASGGHVEIGRAHV